MSNPKQTKREKIKPPPPRTYPPIDSCEGDVGEWLWRTQSPIYRKRVKRAIQAVKTYRSVVHKTHRLSRKDRDSVHRMLDTLTFDATRRVNTGGSSLLAESATA